MDCLATEDLNDLMLRLSRAVGGLRQLTPSSRKKLIKAQRAQVKLVRQILSQVRTLQASWSGVVAIKSPGTTLEKFLAPVFKSVPRATKNKNQSFPRKKKAALRVIKKSRQGLLVS
jgi:hypothetical protein